MKLGWGMRSLLCSLLVLFLFARGSFAQSTVPVNERTGFDAIQQSDLRRDLTYFSSDAFEGRMTLQPGDDRAADWVAEQFAKAGLRPIFPGMPSPSGYFQPFTLIEYVPDRMASRTTLIRDGVQTVWRSPEATGAYKDTVDITAPVVFAGFGITAPELGYDDYKGIDVRGKIVLIFDHEPQEDDPHSVFNGIGNTIYALSRIKILNAQTHGAVAVLIVAEPNRKHPTNAERSQLVGSSMTRSTPIPNQTIQDDQVHIPAEVVLDDVAAKLFATSSTTLSKAQTAIDRDLKPKSQLLPNTVLSIHLSNKSRRVGTVNNVAGLLPGSDPKLSSETIIISAHHDHEGMASCPDPDHPPVSLPVDPHPCPQVWHGADDNGSGTVGVIELARAFSASLARPKRSILFVVFAAEEPGLRGSYWMADHPLRPLATTRAQINFDMIGRDEEPSPQTAGLIEIPSDTTNRLNLIGAPYSADYDKTVREADRAVGLILDERFDHEHILNVLFRSDQFPFLLKDVPAFWWFTGFHPDYHHTTDTVDKIDFAKMTKILQLAYLSAWRFADEKTPPRFIANPSGIKR